MRPAALLLLAVFMTPAAEVTFEGRRSVVLESNDARLSADLLGGLITEFRLKSIDINPFRWANNRGLS